MFKTYLALLMGCLGVREILSQQAVGSQVPLLPARGCSDQPKLSTGGGSVGQETRAPKSKEVCQGQRVG